MLLLHHLVKVLIWILSHAGASLLAIFVKI